MWATMIDPQYRRLLVLSDSHESDLHGGAGLTLQGIPVYPVRIHLMLIIHTPATCNISKVAKM